MKFILSRKGFDTRYGTIANPILPDGTMFPLPIPYGRGSPIRFRDLPPPPGLEAHYGHLGDFVSAHKARWYPVKGESAQLVTADTIAHLDPDVSPGMLRRMPGWRPLFGQTGAALGHLQRMQVGVGDVFLFFSRFDPLLDGVGSPRYRGTPFHAIFGWLQVGRVHQLPSRYLPEWARYHPHVGDDPVNPWPAGNILFEASDRLDVRGLSLDLPGAGLFRYHPCLRLTAPDASAITDWILPDVFSLPAGARRREPTNLASRGWEWDGFAHRVSVTGIWQEAVWAIETFPRSIDWFRSLFQTHVPFPSLVAEVKPMLAAPEDRAMPRSDSTSRSTAGRSFRITEHGREFLRRPGRAKQLAAILSILDRLGGDGRNPVAESILVEAMARDPALAQSVQTPQALLDWYRTHKLEPKDMAEIL